MATDASANDENTLTLTSKILLRHAANKSKAKSWLTASLGATSSPEAEENKRTALPVDPSTSSSSQQIDQDLANLRYDDENSGIGSVRTANDNDDFMSTNRQLSSANDALRRRLLSTDAYKKYANTRTQTQGQARTGPGTSTSRLSTKKSFGDDDDEEEEIKGKGRSSSASSQKIQQRQKSKKNAAVTGNEDGGGSVTVQSTPSTTTGHIASAAQLSDETKVVSTSRKRPGSYLDQVLSKRQQKSNKRTKSEGNNG